MKQQSYFKFFLFSILSCALWTSQAFAVPPGGNNDPGPQPQPNVNDADFFTEQELEDIQALRDQIEGDAAASAAGTTMIVEHANQAFNEDRCGGELDESPIVQIRSYTNDTATGDSRSGDTRYYLTYQRVYNPATGECNMVYVGRTRDGGCFAPETMVMMGDKTLKQIKDIREGDFVWNPALNSAQEVATMVVGPEQEPLIEVGFGDSIVRITQTHPMVVSAPQNGFAPVALRNSSSANSRVVKASELTKDDLLLGSDGEFHQITTLRELPIKEKQYVYNFELKADSHDIEKHLLVADGVITGDVRIQAKLNNQVLPWDPK